MANWHKYPKEKPQHNGEYLIRRISCRTNKLHYWLCLLDGNEFRNVDGEFEFLDVTEL